MWPTGVVISLRPDLTVVSYWPGVVAHRQTAGAEPCYTKPVEDADFSDDFCRFLQAHVPSVDAAERLIAHPDSAPAELAPHVAMLAKAYEERPVTLFRIIYALRDANIRSFSDAFKVRKP
jgi:hypothetical protein